MKLGRILKSGFVLQKSGFVLQFLKYKKHLNSFNEELIFSQAEIERAGWMMTQDVGVFDHSHKPPFDHSHKTLFDNFHKPSFDHSHKPPEMQVCQYLSKRSKQALVLSVNRLDTP